MSVSFLPLSPNTHDMVSEKVPARNAVCYTGASTGYRDSHRNASHLANVAPQIDAFHRISLGQILVFLDGSTLYNSDYRARLSQDDVGQQVAIIILSGKQKMVSTVHFDQIIAGPPICAECCWSRRCDSCMRCVHLALVN